MAPLRWHYTWHHRISEILTSGYVDVARLYVPPTERPVAWFSADQFRENTVRKGDRAFGMKEMVAQGYRLYRVGVLPEAAPLNWTAIRKQSGMSSKIANGMITAARHWGANPFHWYGSFVPVPSSLWQTIERFRDGAWIPSTSDSELPVGLTDSGQLVRSMKTDNALPLLVSIPETCRLLGVSRTTLYALIQFGSLKSKLVRGRRMFRRTDIEAFVRKP